MIPYNPSSFNSNKTILEQILELKRWLQAHPSYEVFYSSEAGNTSQAITSYDLTAVTDPTNMEIGDVVVFHNATFGVVTSVDTDNNEFGCDPCISLAGPQGPQGPQGVSITNVSISGANHLIITLSDGTSIDAGTIQYDTYIDLGNSTSGTLTDEQYAKALLNDTKIIYTLSGTSFIYTKTGESSTNIVYTLLYLWDVWPVPTTYVSYITITKSTKAYATTQENLPIGIDNIKSGAYPDGRVIRSNGSGGVTWSQIGVDSMIGTSVAGQVMVSDGSYGVSWQNPSGGLVELEIAYADIGQALSDSDYAICLNADKMIVNYGAGQLIEYTRDVESSTELKFARTYNSGVDVILVTKATKVVTNPTYKFIANGIDSQTATSGQVLQADGNGGASWQNAGGKTLYMHFIELYIASTSYVTLSIINDSNVSFTTTTLANYLYTNNMRGSNNMAIANGLINDGGTLYQILGLYAGSYSALGARAYNIADGTYNFGNFFSGFNINDNIVQL